MKAIQSYFKKLVNHERKSYLFEIPHHKRNERMGINSYVTNPIIHRCVSLIATSASHIPWNVYKDTGSGKKLIPEHIANKILRFPNPDKSASGFFTENISTLLLYGNSYIFTTSKNYPKEIYNIYPASIEHIVNQGVLEGYKCNFGSGEQIFPIDKLSKISQILHIRNYNPSNQYKGLSALDSAKESINLYAKIIEWNKALLKNSVRPSGALVFQDSNGYLTEDQFDRLKEQFYENFSGSSNSGKPLILEGGLKWQDTKHAQQFEKFLELKDSIARDIAIAFNVPPQLLGISGDNTYSNMQEARMALWEENIIPLLSKYSHALSNWLSHCYQEELIIEFDRDSISILTERRENLWSKIDSTNFMTINEKRSMFNLPKIEGGDKLTSSNYEVNNQ